MDAPAAPWALPGASLEGLGAVLGGAWGLREASLGLLGPSWGVLGGILGSILRYFEGLFFDLFLGAFSEAMFEVF